MRRWIAVLAILLGIAGLTVVLLIHVYLPGIKQTARDDAQVYLTKRLKSSVTFSDFHVALYPNAHITVENLILRHQARTDIPPLIQIKEVSLDATLSSLLHRRLEITNATLVGLQINTPPRAPGSPPRVHGTEEDLAAKYHFVIREIHADDALLTVLRYNSDKPPNQWAIHHLTLSDFSFDRPTNFHAILTNPKPQGEIDCQGTFGPWDAEDPRETPVSAQYVFAHAELGTLKGIRGILSSTGKFSGPLDYLTVVGVTDTPDFALRVSGHPMALHTDFNATVDGSNGNTVLNNVTATFLHTTLVTHGGVVDVYPNVKGRTIALDAVADNARIEDLLLLAVKSDQPVMTGSARLKTKILIPEEDTDVIERLRLDGQFGIGNAHFTSPTVQSKIDALSRRGQGKPKAEYISDEVSDLQGSFKMDHEAIRFSDLTFGVEGANISLEGTYGIDSGQIDFRGKLRTDAKLSQMVTGWKSVVLKPFDGFFKGKNGGAEIPIKITGTRDHPTYGTDFHDKDNKK
jgi:AsmA-like C-terminal region